MTSTFSEETLSEIEERISLMEIISPYVRLEKAGKYYKGLCPFHPDKNPSFIVNEQRKTFHCFGCKTGGDVYSFYMKFHNCSFPQAVRELAQRTGISLSSKSLDTKDKELLDRKEAAFRINQITCHFFNECLVRSADAGRAREILYGRGVDQKSIKQYHIGYAPNQWDHLYRYLQKQRVPANAAESLGLILPRKNAQGYYDRFRSRLMFPILDISGRILGFGGRVLDDGEPKYMNSPESFLYSKSASLFGLHEAQQAIRVHGYAIVVEGYFDLLTLHRFGFPHTVAVLGTSVTAQQVDLIGRYTRKVTLIFDGDPAGKKASVRSLERFFEKGFSVRSVFLPQGHDPDSFLLEVGPDPFRTMLETAKPIFEAILDDQVRGQTKLSTEKKIEIMDALLPLVGKIPDPIERNLWAKQIAEELGIDEPLLREEISKHSGERVRPGSVQDTSTHFSRLPPEERLICQLLLQFPPLILQFNQVNTELAILETFKSSQIKEVIAEVTKEYERKGSIHLSRMMYGKDQTAMGDFLSHLTCSDEFTEEEASAALNDSIRRIRLRMLREEAQELNRRIRDAEKGQQHELCLQLSLKKQELFKRERHLTDV